MLNVFDIAFIGLAATCIINDVKGESRVACVVTSKPLETIERVEGERFGVTQDKATP